MIKKYRVLRVLFELIHYFLLPYQRINKKKSWAQDSEDLILQRLLGKVSFL